MSKKRLLVTGGCGFIGKNLVNGFCDAGFDVTVIDFGGRAFRDDVTFIDLDIREKEKVIAACEGMDTIVHNASIVHTKTSMSDVVWSVNHQGSLNIIEACRAHKIPKLVFISSASAVYEGKDISYGDETLPYSTISQAAYADSKIAAEKEVLKFSGTADTACCAIRPHVVFGPEDNRFIPAILKNAKAGKLKRSVGDRDKLSDFTYISNLVDAVIAVEKALILKSPVEGEAYFVTNGEPIAFYDFIENLIVTIGYPRIQGKIPFWLAYSAAAVMEGVDVLMGGTFNEDGLTRFSVKYMVTDHYYSIEKAYKDFGWKPAVTLVEGIKLTVNDLVAKGKVVKTSNIE